jgi:protein-tyrosine phosphatase
VVKSILFVCTGNVFRSLTAECALKTLLGPESGYLVGSAGIEAVPQPVHPMIRDRLLEKGADPATHAPRRLTQELLDRTDLPIAMSLDHRDFIRQHFRREVLLFNQVCFQREEPVLDVHEAIPAWNLNGETSSAYVRSVVDYIWDAMPAFIRRIPHL